MNDRSNQIAGRNSCWMRDELGRVHLHEIKGGARCPDAF
jgi:hypothetical protein